MRAGVGVLRLTGTLCAVVVVLAKVGSLAHSPKPASCVESEYRQFDFWMGMWDTFEADSLKKDAHARVDRDVRQTAGTVTDNGKTWKPWLDLLLRLATPGGFYRFDETIRKVL